MTHLKAKFESGSGLVRCLLDGTAVNFEPQLPPLPTGSTLHCLVEGAGSFPRARMLWAQEMQLTFNSSAV